MNEHTDRTPLLPRRQLPVSANRRNASVGKAAALLRAAGAAPDGASVSALARATGLPRATALRMIDALEAEGLLTRLRDRDVVLLGTGVLDLAAAVRPERLLVEAARGPLEVLVRTTGESATLTVRSAEAIVCIFEVIGPRLIGPATWLGRTWPLHLTAAGKLALAAMPESELVLQLARPLERFTDASVTSPAAIRATLPEIRACGFATATDELEVGLTAIAVPVPGSSTEAYVGVSGPTYRFTSAAAAVAVTACQAAADAIAAALR